MKMKILKQKDTKIWYFKYIAGVCIFLYPSPEFTFACSAEFNQLQQQEGETGLEDAS